MDGLLKMSEVLEEQPCLEHRSLLANTTYSVSLTLKVWRSSYWICICVCIEREMNVMSKGGVEVWTLVSATWHCCDLTFIKLSVVKLDYGKVSASDISSFNITLWYAELHKMI